MTNAADTDLSADRSNVDARPVKLACRNVWKLYGSDAGSFIRQHQGRASSQEIAAAGLIGAARAVDLEIRQGEIFIIMGLSGSGKSTLVRCMSRLVEPTYGRVEFEGKDLLKISDAELIELRRHRMGMVFQNFALLPHLNVIENIAFPLSIQGMDRAARDARAREVIELVGLRGRERFYPRELSGGQQQRVGIARSLATKPEIWFLDEPFSALDPLIRREMQDELMRLQAVLHKTIVFITHDFDEAIRLADRIAIMKDGEVIQVGTPEELVVKPATDYVAEFTRDVQRAKVISARSLMQPLRGDRHGGQIAPDAKIASFSAGIVSSGKPFAVVNGGGQRIGEVTPEAVIALLAGIGQEPAQA
ncbi:MAG: betaine/proline/choline family ABC transporter ATP-binding protein [Rhizobiaceae bacterium]|nr:betaine/proline/choline family ABC transporter ATP-binding protein [Rhizobiaceae bacterium]